MQAANQNNTCDRYGITAESSRTSKIAIAERLLLDPDVIINLLKKHPETVERFMELSERGTIFLLSPIVIAEVYAGAFKHEHPQIETFFSLCQPLTLDGEVAVKIARIEILLEALNPVSR